MSENEIGQERRSGDQSPAFAYLVAKAEIYCKIGRAKYRKGDALRMPAADWSDETLDAVDRGMQQICRGWGRASERPLDGIGIEGFYALVETLHLEVTQQSAIGTEDGSFLDQMQIRHMLRPDMELTLFNLVT